MEKKKQLDGISLSLELRTGNREIFSRLFYDYYDDLCYFLNSYTQDQDISREIVHTVFIRLWEKRESIRIRENIKSYLYKSVYNEAINYIKREKNRRNKESDAAREIVVTKFLVDEEIAYRDLDNQLKRALDKMPERRYTIFILNRQGGLTYAEIAQVLGIAEKTVENHMGHALKYLREALKQ